MTYAQLLESASKQLRLAGIASARLDTLLLLEHTLQKDRAWILAHPEASLNKSQLERLEKYIERRANYEPVAYIRGMSEFYGRTFIVTPATLQPRPETETIISEIKNLPLNHSMIADIGTGSGCIAITAKLEIPHATVIGIELNKDALKIARQNAHTLHADVEFYEGDLLLPIKNHKIDVVAANLPYVPDTHTINEAAMFEPRMAIFGGEDGLDLYRRLFEQISKRKQMPMYVITESLPTQHQNIAKIAHNSGYALKSQQDFIQVFHT